MKFDDPIKSFLLSSGWSGAVSSGRNVLDFIELLSPDTEFLDRLSDEELLVFEQYFGVDNIDHSAFQMSTPETIRADRVAIIRQLFNQLSFNQIEDLALGLDIEETFSGKPLEDLNRLLLKIPVLTDTILDEKPIPLTTTSPKKASVIYLAPNEEFITFGSIIIHARFNEIQNQLKLNSLYLYCNWKPNDELGEMLVDRLFTHSDFSKKDDGTYVINANVTKGAVLKLVLLLRTGTNIDPWQHQPNWRLLGASELAAVNNDELSEINLVNQKLQKLPPDVIARTKAL